MDHMIIDNDSTFIPCLEYSIYNDMNEWRCHYCNSFIDLWGNLFQVSPALNTPVPLNTSLIRTEGLKNQSRGKIHSSELRPRSDSRAVDRSVRTELLLPSVTRRQAAVTTETCRKAAGNS